MLQEYPHQLGLVLIGEAEGFRDVVEKGPDDERHGRVGGDVGYLVAHVEEEFPDGPVVDVVPLHDREHHVLDEHQGDEAHDAVVVAALASLGDAQHALADLVKDLGRPSPCVQLANLLVTETGVGGEEDEPVLPVRGG